MTNPIALDLLKLAEHYLSALHGSVARHDNIGLNLSCGGCALRDEIRDVLPKLAAAVSVPPPAPRADDRGALRDRIADALARLDAEKWGVEIPAKDHPFWQMYPTQADAVLAELPEPADRAAVLREAADIAESLRQFELAFGARKSAQVSENVGVLRVVEELRRRADCPSCDAGIEHDVHCPTPETHNAGCGCGTDLDASGPCVAGEQQNETPEAEIEHLRDRLASCRERVGIAADKAIAAEDAIARARRARRRLTSALIAVEPLLTEPYPDDPRWTPWTRFVGPALKELSDALKTARPESSGPEEQNETPDDVDPVYDPRAWETYRRDAGCGCTAPAPVDCKIPHGTGAWLCTCHRLSGPPWKDGEPRGTFLTDEEEAVRKHFQEPNRCTSTDGIFRCSRPTGHLGDHRTGRTFWARRPTDAEASE